MVKQGKYSGRFAGDQRGAVTRKEWDLKASVNGNGDHQRHFVDNIRRTSTSFFFTNFPDDATRSVLWKVFDTVGKVVDVFISAKVDKLGRRFGFVRFKEVEDVDLFKQKLDGVWLGSYKLHINQSHGAVKDAARTSNGGVGAVNPSKERMVVREVVKGKAAVDGSEPRFRWGEWPEMGAWKQKPFGVNRKNEKTFNIEYEASEERVKFLKSCFMGVLPESKSATPLEVQHSLVMEGYHAIKVSLMGGYNSSLKFSGRSNN